MHPRNPYKDSLDFYNLAEFFPSLKSYILLSPSGKPTIDFKDANAQRTLTQALLKRDFNIDISLPEDRLCPPIPNRLNYVLWIQDILFPYDKQRPDVQIKGLDIGTGASAIYPLLACSLPVSSNWSFVGTEIDSHSYHFASRNVEVNNLQSRITIWPISSASTILEPLTKDLTSHFDFTMCNPPFYGSAFEIANSAESKERPPNAACTGAVTEMITPGGETAFVLRMLQESARADVRHRCRWFTSMLGKLSSVGEITQELNRLEIDNYALTQFVQGTTRRWAIAWSFRDGRLPDTLARPSSSSLSPFLPAPTTLRQSFPITPHIESAPAPHGPSSSFRSHTPVPSPNTPISPSDLLHKVFSKVLTSIEGIEFTTASDDDSWIFNVRAGENTWSRAARRKRKRGRSTSPNRDGYKTQGVINPHDHKTRIPPHKCESHKQGSEAVFRETQDVKPSSQRRSTNSSIDPKTKIEDAESTQYGGISNPQLCCHISLEKGAASAEVQWVRGTDRALFEGLWSHLCRKVRDALAKE